MLGSANGTRSFDKRAQKKVLLYAFGRRRPAPFTLGHLHGQKGRKKPENFVLSFDLIRHFISHSHIMSFDLI